MFNVYIAYSMADVVNYVAWMRNKIRYAKRHVHARKNCNEGI